MNAQQGLSLSGLVADATGKPLVNLSVELVGSKVAPKSSAGTFPPASRSVTLKDKSVDGVDFTLPAPKTNAFSGGS